MTIRTRGVLIITAIVIIAGVAVGVVFIRRAQSPGGSVATNLEAKERAVSGQTIAPPVVSWHVSSTEQDATSNIAIAEDENGNPLLSAEEFKRLTEESVAIEAHERADLLLGQRRVASSSAPVSTPPQNSSAVDTDGDGLSDSDEAGVYRTNPRTVDTDNDGLSDFDEVKMYKTNPNVKDTDGDGFDDGTEVSKGYNPLGSGKL
jgi:hypothetical protein